jgi:hypothetical protein
MNSTDVFIGNFERNISVTPKKPISVEAVKAAESAGEAVSTVTKAGAVVGAIAGIIGFVFGFAMAGVFLKFS